MSRSQIQMRLGNKLMNKKTLSERDICTKYITPAIAQAGWDVQTQIREEVTFTKGRIIVRGRMHMRGESRRADYVLYHQPNQPIAVIEAKDNRHTVEPPPINESGSGVILGRVGTLCKGEENGEEAIHGRADHRAFAAC